MKSVLLAASALIATPALAANVDIAVQGPVVEITASETVQSEPDRATVGAGVTTRARTAVQAMRDNANKMDAVIGQLRGLGIAREDIQTSGVNLNAAFQYNNNNTPPVFQGYDVTNQVSVTLKDIAKIGATLDALVAAGANNINGPYFSRDDDKAQRGIARETAFKSAEEQARDYARMAGYTNLRLLSVEETLQRGVPIPFDVANQAAIRVTAAKVTPIEPGRVGTSVQLTAKYEMTR
ncbi:SIMPL domain-containing protein [Novosphingobium sp. Gsoil 351]|uniref:SIMPL domain-containing protein n=1 Tax=Novosphingobium sp. Gsoil 351 TaxID=2675225 RepID=UPI0018A7EFDD|nr:SIMPL domain-containing protein [Novosphingobium sp. Gsoil 351]